jgi:hypothetical protein
MRRRRSRPLQHVEGRLAGVQVRGGGFIVPFFFVYYPALLFTGPWSEIALAAVTGGIGVDRAGRGPRRLLAAYGELGGARALRRRPRCS